MSLQKIILSGKKEKAKPQSSALQDSIYIAILNNPEIETEVWAWSDKKEMELEGSGTVVLISWPWKH
jgi:hypothetical protein